MGEQPTLLDLIKKVGSGNQAAAEQETKVKAARAEEAEISRQFVALEQRRLAVAPLVDEVKGKKELLSVRQKQLILLQRALAGALQRRAAQGAEVAQAKSTAQGALIIARAESLLIEKAMKGLDGEKQSVVDVFEVCEMVKKLYDAGVKVGVIQPSPSAEERQAALAEQQLKLLEKLQGNMAALMAQEQAELEAARGAAAAAGASPSATPADSASASSKGTDGASQDPEPA